MHAPETIQSLHDKQEVNGDLLRSNGIDSSKTSDPSPVACAPVVPAYVAGAHNED
jgi:hypothetical protein